MVTAHWQLATSLASSASVSPGHIAPFENGSPYGTVSPFIAAWLGLGLPLVTSHVFVAPRRGAHCRTDSSAAHPATAVANAVPPVVARLSSATSYTSRGVRSVSSSVTTSTSSRRVAELTIFARRSHMERM